MPQSFVLIAYLVAAVCFVLSLGGLSRHETARRGNALGIIGIVIAILVTLLSGEIRGGMPWIIGAIVLGRFGGDFHRHASANDDDASAGGDFAQFCGAGSRARGHQQLYRPGASAR